MRGPPLDRYEFLLMRKLLKLDIGQEFSFDGVTTMSPPLNTVGTCSKPKCKDADTQLEIQYWGGFFYSFQSFRVETKRHHLYILSESD